MKKIKNISVAALLTSAILLSSCIGSFKLTKTVYGWNSGVGEKFVNELVFLVCLIVPVYEVSVVVDAVVLNSIEFWSGENPMTMKNSEKHQKTVEIDGKSYQLTSEKYKMTIEEIGKSNSKAELVFRTEDNSWYLRKGKKMRKLVEVNMEDGKAISYHVFYPDGSEKTINTNFDPSAIQNEFIPNQKLAYQQ